MYVYSKFICISFTSYFSLSMRISWYQELRDKSMYMNYIHTYVYVYICLYILTVKLKLGINAVLSFYGLVLSYYV